MYDTFIKSIQTNYQDWSSHYFCMNEFNFLLLWSMINNIIIGKRKNKKTLLMGPQDQHHEMGCMTASLIHEQCGGMRISLCWLMYKVWKVGKIMPSCLYRIILEYLEYLEYFHIYFKILINDFFQFNPILWIQIRLWE